MQANLERESGLGPLPFDSSPRDEQETKDFVPPRLFDPGANPDAPLILQPRGRDNTRGEVGVTSNANRPSGDAKSRHVHHSSEPVGEGLAQCVDRYGSVSTKWRDRR